MSSKWLRVIPTPHFLEEGGRLLLLAEVRAALKARDLPEGAGEDLQWLRKGLEIGLGFAQVLHGLHACLAEAGGSKPAPKAFGARMVKELQRLEEFLQEASAKETICPLGADVRVWWDCLEALKQAVAKPPASVLQTPVGQHQWW